MEDCLRAGNLVLRNTSQGCFEILRLVADNNIAIFLTGHKRFRCFWWRADFTLVDNEAIIRGPFLAADCDS